MVINKKLIKYNYNKGRIGNKIIYIVVHDTGNKSIGANAISHYNYFNSANRDSSAHYFVDDKQIVQLVNDADTSWHCGDGKGKYGITNANSIGIEICVNKDGDYNKAVALALKLVKYLMQLHNIKIDKVVRHYDTSRKICPRSMSANYWLKWDEFKANLIEGDDIILAYTRTLSKGMSGNDVRELQKYLVNLGYDPKGIDGIFGDGLDKAVRLFQKNNKLLVDGYAGKATINKINELTSNPKQPAFPKSMKCYLRSVEIIKAKAKDTNVKFLGTTLQAAKVEGVNLNFFDTPRPNNPDSCWGIAVRDGKAVGGNSMLVSYKPEVRRGTIINYVDGTVGLEIVNNMNEFKKKARWAASGHSIYPTFNENEITSDINYKTNHTYIGYKGTDIYMMIKPDHMIRDFIPFVKYLELDGCIVVDGGSSTQLEHPNGSYRSKRAICTALVVE